MKANIGISTDKMIPITYARRNLGEIINRLASEGELYLMRGSKIAAKLSLPQVNRDEHRKRTIDKVFGAWKGTDLDNDALWEEILVKERRSGTRKRRIML